MNPVTGGTETAEIVYEVRDETRVIAVEKGLQKADSVTIVYVQKQPAFSPQGEIELSRLGVLALGSCLSLLSSTVYFNIFVKPENFVLWINL